MSLIRLYTDEDVTDILARTLRGRGFDVLSVHETETQGATDAEQLTFAATQKRSLLTFNVADFVRLHQEYLTVGKAHHGISVSTQTQLPELLRRTLRLLETLQAEEMPNRLEWLNTYCAP